MYMMLSGAFHAQQLCIEQVLTCCMDALSAEKRCQIAVQACWIC